MKKLITLLLAVVMMLTVATACSTEETNTFTVGFDASFPPYGYQDDNGDYVGFDLDLAEEVCKRRGWTLKKQPIDWNAKDFELESGNIDCLWNGFTINGREDGYEWTDAYVDNSQVFVVKTDAGITDFAGLKDKNVVVQADSSALAALQNEEDAEIKALTASFKSLTQVPEYNTAFLNLDSGAADAIAMDIGVAEYQIENRGADKFMILEKVLASEQYGVGFKKGNTELRDQVQETLNEMVEDGTFAKIAEKWGLTDSVCLGK